MPHELLQALKLHLSSNETELDNGDDWGMVQKWLLIAAQTDDVNPTKSHIAFSTGALLSNDELIHRWIGDRLDSTLGRRPDPLVAGASSLGFQGDMATVRNMSGIIATEVGRGLGAVMQQATKAGTPLVGGTSTSEDAKPYNQDQLAALLGFHNVKNVQYLQKVWRQFKAQKTPNYDMMRRAIKSEMLAWADWSRCWIKEGVYFDNKTLDEWIALKFNPGDSTALYSSADKGISILKCRQPSSALLEQWRYNEEVWDATKGNATYVDVVKQGKNKEVCTTAHDYMELRSNIATFCALLFTLFGDRCDLYRSMLEILQILSHPFCGQNKLAYTPEVCRRITWAIIVDTRSFFNDIKLADDFLSGQRLQMPVSTLDGDYMAIKHGIKIERHNFPLEWGAPGPSAAERYQPPGMNGGYGRSGRAPSQAPPGTSPPSNWQQPTARTPTVPFNWRPAGFVDGRHAKFQAMMEPLLMKYRGKISVSTILTEAGNRFNNLPKLEKYPQGVCWLHALATCPYVNNCSFATGHITQGDLTETQVDEVVAALQPGVTALLAHPASPAGKRKWKGRGGMAGGQPPRQLM